MKWLIVGLLILFLGNLIFTVQLSTRLERTNSNLLELTNSVASISYTLNETQLALYKAQLQNAP